MEQAPTEIIEKIAGHCDEPTLNSLTRTNSTTNEKVNAYPGRVYEHIKKHQPEKLAQELLNMIDPASLITYQLDSTLDLAKLDEFTGDFDDYPFYLRFKLGTLELFSLSFLLCDIPDYPWFDSINYPISKFEFANEDNCALVRTNISEYMADLAPTTNGGIWSELYSSQGINKNLVLQFRPEVFDAIINDLKRIVVLTDGP